MVPVSEPAEVKDVIGALSTILMLAAPPAASAKSDHASTVIADFGASVYGAGHGIFRCIGGDPNQVTDALVELGAERADCWKVELAADAPRDGAGMLIPLFDESADLAQPNVDIAPGGGFELRLCGSLGQRALGVEFVSGENPDATGVELSRIHADDLDAHRWQMSRAVLAESLYGKQRGGYLRVVAHGAGPAWFALDRIDATGVRLDGAPSERGAAAHALRTALWVWRTREILPDPKRRAALMAFCTRHDITDLFVQIPYVYQSGAVAIEHVAEQRQLNAAARNQGITVHALDGNPSYVLRENHDRMSALLTALEEFNQEAADAERYPAVHLDNEPYVLKEWRDDDRRKAIIRDFVELQRRLGDQANRQNLKYGIDIPFWFDVKSRDGRHRFMANTDSGEVPLLEAIFPHLDNVGIMSYRERALGTDGVVAHCINEFRLGERTGVDVFASVEIGVNENVEPRTTFGRYPIRYFDSQLSTLRRVLATMPGCAGIAIHYYSEYDQWERRS